MLKQYPDLKQMKQLNINELNKLNIEMLSPYWKEAQEQRLIYDNIILGIIRKWCTIGRMIELIHYETLDMSMDYDFQFDKWFVKVKIGNELDFKCNYYSNKNLCDALWEMTLYFINNKLTNA